MSENNFTFQSMSYLPFLRENAWDSEAEPRYKAGLLSVYRLNGRIQRRMQGGGVGKRVRHNLYLHILYYNTDNENIMSHLASEIISKHKLLAEN